MRRRRHQQQPLRATGKLLAERVTLGPVELLPLLDRIPTRGSRALVRLVDHHQVPVGSKQVGEDLVALGEVDRGDAAIVLEPRQLPKLPPHLMRIDDREAFIELVVELVLPLDRQRGRAEDQYPVGHHPQPQLLEQEPRHDRLARARIVREHEPQPRLGKHVLVDRDDLVR
jgi:hypothetical protein